ncbi:DUF4262 domain-containing protein [Paenarthrobacter sp. PH39-S1]|uniref:DUF4262 domain-containing protein n=1 Tax=Paenarthrobacter sp. PH39-S1 TaxID=3046204 RepID=UPI0024B88BF8|nr:DUF4262 domain-containing protein [Paenarthrobacter sp. PH39-S1]MDJ0355486.1 DUF4262 domain-containing protein [Paenarthrobacter sp. PH39-S1]
MMCDMCNGATAEEANEKFRRMLDRYGVAIQGVEGDSANTAFAYTVGLTALQGHPELLMSGRPLQDMARLLNELADMVRFGGRRLEAGMLVALQGRSVQLLDIPRASTVLLTADTYYGEGVRALQAIWADDDGHLPWEQRVPDTLTQPMYCMNAAAFSRTGRGSA